MCQAVPRIKAYFMVHCSGKANSDPADLFKLRFPKYLNCKDTFCLTNCTGPNFLATEVVVLVLT